MKYIYVKIESLRRKQISKSKTKKKDGTFVHSLYLHISSLKMWYVQRDIPNFLISFIVYYFYLHVCFIYVPKKLIFLSPRAYFSVYIGKLKCHKQNHQIEDCYRKQLFVIPGIPMSSHIGI